MSSPKRSAKAGLTRNSTRTTSGFTLGLRRDSDQIGDRLQMVVHRRRGRLAVFRRNGLEYSPVRLESRLFSSGGAQRDRALARQPLDQSVVNRDEDRILSDPRQDVVEGDVGSFETGNVAARGRIGFKGPPELLNVFGARAHRREACYADLKKSAGLLEMFQPAGAGKKVPRDARKLGDQIF